MVDLIVVAALLVCCTTLWLWWSEPDDDVIVHRLVNYYRSIGFYIDTSDEEAYNAEIKFMRDEWLNNNNDWIRMRFHSFLEKELASIRITDKDA